MDMTGHALPLPALVKQHSLIYDYALFTEYPRNRRFSEIARENNFQNKKKICPYHTKKRYREERSGTIQQKNASF